MNQLELVMSHLESNLGSLKLEWLNVGRVSDDWKVHIFSHKTTKQQIGIYNRKTMILVRLESYSTDIKGITVLPKIVKSHALEASLSKFRGGKGVCVVAESQESFKTLIEWYFLQNF